MQGMTVKEFVDLPPEISPVRHSPTLARHCNTIGNQVRTSLKSGNLRQVTVSDPKTLD